MNIYQCLESDHRKFESLIDRLQKASQSDNAQWKSLLDELRAGLIPHAHAEEAVFYNALREIPETKNLVAHSYSEHAMAESEIRMLEGAKHVDTNWKGMIGKLRSDLEKHIRDEETRVFAAARKVLSEEEANKIGAAFLKLKPEMAKDAESMVASTMDLIANLLPARFSQGFRKYLSRNRKDAA
jgi:hemerythrin superfamily protein